MKRLVIAAVAFAIGCRVISADDKTEEYREFVDEIRTEVYGMDLPAFKVTEIPDKYKNESAVLIAVYHGVNAEKKTGFGHKEGSLMTFTRKARVEGDNLLRMLIHINDKAALEKYSEFDFATDVKKKYWNAHEKLRRVMGVRLVKPDGRVIDVDTGDYVEVEEGKKGEEKRRKLAIPGLEVGDNIDVFFYTETKLQNVHPDPMQFCLRDDYPILNYRIHCVVDNNLTTQYRTLNGAPDFTITRDENDNYVLDLEVPDISAKEPRLWYNAEQQSPMVKMRIYNRRSQQFTPESARRDGVQSNPDVRIIKEDRWGTTFQSTLPTGDRFISSNVKDGKKILKQLDKLRKSGAYSTSELADYYYNLTMFMYMSHRAKPDAVLSTVWNILARRKTELPRGMTTSDGHEPLDELINYGNAMWYLREPESGKYYFPFVDGIFAPSEIHPSVQGRKAQDWRKKKEREKHPEADSVYFYIPVMSPDLNRNVTSVRAAVDGASLEIHRTESYTGSTKRGVQWLLTEEDIVDGYLAFLNRDGIEVKLPDKKKDASERAERYADARREQADDFKTEIEGYHGIGAASFVSGRVTSIGVDPASPELTYEVTYTMDDLVKRAGRNTVLSVGKLMSVQTEVFPADRERTEDVYMSSPREFVTRIDVALPAGTRVAEKSLAALEESVVNDAGAFIVKASVESGNLAVEVTKRYNHKVEPASAWPGLVKILDAAKDWEARTVLIER